MDLAVNHFLSITPSTGVLLDKVNELMKDLNKLKNASILRSIKDTNGPMPVTRNVTRWSSTCEMLVRFLILVPSLHNCGLPEATKALIPTYVEIHELNELKDQLKDFQDTTLSLQSDSGRIDLYFVRTLFDNLIRKHPSCVKHLSPISDIVHNRHFENGIVKIQSMKEDALTGSEMHAVSIFLKTTDDDDDDDDDDGDNLQGRTMTLLEKTREETKLGKRNRGSLQVSNYMTVSHVIPTSNRVERMFSRCKLIMNDLRASMHPRTLENFMMLRENKHLWGQHTVEEALARKDVQWPDEMDDSDEDEYIDPALINVTLDSDNE